jgi:hypothetical protein
MKKHLAELQTFRAIESGQHNTKLFWKRVHELYDPLKGGKLLPAVLDLDGNVITNHVEVLNTWKEYIRFLGKEQSIERRSDPHSDRIANDDSEFDDDFARGLIEELRRIHASSSELYGGSVPELDKAISFEEVHAVFRDLKYGTCPGVDGVVPELLMKGGIGLEMATTKLFNFLCNGVLWPEAWRRAHLFPLHKGGEKLDPPITTG